MSELVQMMGKLVAVELAKVVLLTISLIAAIVLLSADGVALHAFGVACAGLFVGLLPLVPRHD